LGLCSSGFGFSDGFDFIGYYRINYR
jgi:hypothetical protein